MPAPLTIGFVSSTFAPLPGGREAYLDHLSHALAEQGHAVRVAPRFVDARPEPFKRLLASHEPARSYDANGIEVRVLGLPPLRQMLLRPAARLHFYPSTEAVAIRLYQSAFAAPMADALNGCDIVHYSGTGRELIGFAARQIAARNGQPFFVTPHMHVGSWGDSPLDLRLYRQADHVIALTEYERAAYIDKGIAPERVHVQGHGLNVAGSGDAHRFRRESGIGEAPVILFLGRKSAEKGYPLLLRAAPALWARHPTAQIVIAGPSDDATVLSPAERRIAADPRIWEYGFVDDDLREDLYAACDLFCLPSEAEAFGLVYLEAAAYGKPVVGLDIPPLRELIGGGQTGILTAPTPPQLAETLCQLLHDDETRKRLGQNGQRIARQQTWAHVAEAMTALYRSALSTPSAVAA